MAVAIATITVILTFFSPGLLLASILDQDPVDSIAIAPALSCFLLLSNGIALHALNIDATPVTMLAIPVILLAFFCALRKREPRRCRARSTVPRSQAGLLCLYILIGSSLVLFVYINHLHGLDSFQPDNDNSTHLALIKNMIATHDMSVLSTGAYLDTVVYPDATNTGSFYPAVFHTISALAIMTSEVKLPAAENIASAVIIASVYTSGCYALFKSLGHKDKFIQISGSATCLMVVGFPWRFIVWGPLYPNLLSLSLIPTALSLEMKICDRFRDGRPLVSQIAIFAMSLIAIAGSHPNGIFTLGVLSIPLIVHTVYNLTKADTDGLKIKPVISASATVAVIIAVWIACYKLPQLQSVVTYRWAANQSLPQAVQSLLLFGFTREATDPLLSVLLCVGIMMQLNSPDRRWTIGSYLITAVMFVAAVSSDGTIKQIMCGFWYCDHTRIAACTSLSAMVLITFGLAAILHGASAVASKRRIPNESAFTFKALLTVFLSAAIAVPVFTGNPFGGLSTFQDYRQLLDYKYADDSPKVYSKREEEFVERVKDIVPSDATVLNIPFDGSCFAYDLQNMGVYYRDPHISGNKGGNESRHSWLYRKYLSKYLANKEVAEALVSDNIKYVLLLDDGHSDNEPERFFPGYSETDWAGLTSIHKGTPGFNLVLSQGDMKLYRISFHD